MALRLAFICALGIGSGNNLNLHANPFPNENGVHNSVCDVHTFTHSDLDSNLVANIHKVSNKDPEFYKFTDKDSEPDDKPDELANADLDKDLDPYRNTNMEPNSFAYSYMDSGCSYKYKNPDRFT